MNKATIEAIEEYVGQVPAHIQACASAIRYDLMHGPCWSRIPSAGIEAFTADDFATFREDLEGDVAEGDVIETTYGGTVEDTLRAYIDALPSALWIDDGGFATDVEPEGEWLDEDCEPCEPDAEGAAWCEESYTLADTGDIVEALFGKVIARDF